jgi:hypothetical protein
MGNEDPTTETRQNSDWYVDAMERLVATIQELSLARSLEDIMVIVRSAARQLTSADGATFVLRDAERCFYADEDAITPLWKGKRFPMEICVSGWVMKHRKSVIVEDVYDDPRVPADAYRPTFVKSLAMVPIRTKNPVGAIGVYWAKRTRPRPEEVKVLQALADSTSVMMENVRVYSDLEKKVAARTASLESLNQEMEAFSYSVSHDLRAPLRHIEGFINLLNKKESMTLSATAQNYLKIISDASVTMGKLIDDLLEFSRTGRTEMKLVRINMNQMVEDARRRLEPKARESAIVWNVAELPEVEADVALLKLVWINLLSNAVKYTRKTTQAEVHVGATERDGEVEFFVRDNGAGFDMNYAHKLFGVFSRLHHQNEFEGTGIGLANVKRIISRHGGRVWAQGQVNAGATFYFTLPAAK